MGDALSIQERDLMDLGDPAPGNWHRLLKPGHHGSRSASDPAWIESLHPEVALITAGRGNSFGFPNEETLATLKASGCQALVTGASFGLQARAMRGGWSLLTGDGEVSGPQGVSVSRFQ
jgi:competence protein ComEC